MDKLKKTAIGIRVHSGWGALVAVFGDPGAAEVIRRKRVAIIDEKAAGAAQPYHFAEKMAFGDAEKHIAMCAATSASLALAALTHARATGVGQKVDCSLLGGQIRLMGWTLTTTMWRNRDPVTGQARITGTA